MSPLTEPTRIVLRNGWQPMDPDAAAYITAVETADGQALEEPVKIAIDNFVLGCKQDGIWDAIKASCILSGARTLNGALVPLAGTAPTNFNFVAGDYDRKTGLVGDGSTKYLDTNFLATDASIGQNNRHAAVFTSESGGGYYIGVNGSATAYNSINISGSQVRFGTCTALADFFFAGSSTATGFIGWQRSSSTSALVRVSSSTTPAVKNSVAPPAFNFFCFARSNTGAPSAYSNARLSFYSAGSAIDLALLDARVTDLINKFAEVIP